jgi:hypothetical protein
MAHHNRVSVDEAPDRVYIRPEVLAHSCSPQLDAEVMAGLVISRMSGLSHHPTGSQDNTGLSNGPKQETLGKASMGFLDIPEL